MIFWRVKIDKNWLEQYTSFSKFYPKWIENRYWKFDDDLENNIKMFDYKIINKKLVENKLEWFKPLEYWQFKIKQKWFIRYFKWYNNEVIIEITTQDKIDGVEPFYIKNIEVWIANMFKYLNIMINRLVLDFFKNNKETLENIFIKSNISDNFEQQKEIFFKKLFDDNSNIDYSVDKTLLDNIKKIMFEKYLYWYQDVFYQYYFIKKDNFLYLLDIYFKTNENSNLEYTYKIVKHYHIYDVLKNVKKWILYKENNFITDIKFDNKIDNLFSL